MPWWDYATAASVAALGLIPVALGEQEFRSFPPFDVWQQVMGTRSFAIAQPDVGYSGGITTFLRVAAAAKAAGARVDPHSPNPSLNDVFVLHFFASLEPAVQGLGVEYACVDGGVPSSFIFTPPLVLAAGGIVMPQGPGWGVGINASWAARTARRVTDVARHSSCGGGGGVLDCD